MQTRQPIYLPVALLLQIAVCHQSHADDPTQPAEPQAQKAPVGLPIVTVNIKSVFDRHAGFQKEMEKLRSEAAKLVDHHARLENEIEARKKQLGSGDLSDEARKKLNDELLRAEAEMSTYIPLKKRELMEREARLYASVYKELEEAAATLARKYRSQIVLRDHELDVKTLSTANTFAILFQQGVDKTDELVHLANGSDAKRDDQVKPDEAAVAKDQLEVAVADFHKILSAYPKYESRIASLREKQRELEQELADEQSKLNDLETQASLLDQGSNEYLKLAQQAALQKAKAEVSLKAKKEQFEAETAQAARQTLKEITHLIGEFSRTHGISLVVHIDSASIDPKDPASVLKGVAKPVVYHADHDISDDIISLISGDEQDANDSQDDDNSKEETRFAGKVAVIDMAVIYQSNERFTAQMANLKQDIAKFSAYLQNRQNALEDLKSLLNALEEGTEAHQSTSKQLARETAELQVEVELKKSELKRKEAICYAATYGDIQETLTRVARASGIGLVVRFDSQPINADDRNSILSGVNRTVVFQDEVDLTDDVIRLTKAASTVELR